jgi:hypothetical protein
VIEPRAVRSVIAEIARRARLRYVLIVGDDTVDPRGYLGGEAFPFVPSAVGYDGEFGRVPSENGFADVNGDGLPDVAIGRLPVNTAEQAEALVEKLSRQQETLIAAGGRQLFAADRTGGLDSGFEAEAGRVADTYYAGASRSWAFVGAGVAEARTALLSGLAQGVQAVHYFGHGGPEVWSDQRLLTVPDAASLQGTGHEAVLFTWACEAQWYQYHLGPSVNEALMLVPQGGALAAFGPAGITDPLLQRVLYEGVYEELARGRSLGEAIQRAKARALRVNPRALAVVAGFNLLGDPSLTLPAVSRRSVVLP